MADDRKVVILTGAGVSAESGLGTFRDKGGLWTQYDLEEVATPEGYARNPDLVLDFYNARRRNCVAVHPNAAHRALAALQVAAPDRVTLITQNVDDLHERAGSVDVIHMHGELLRARCGACGAETKMRGDITRRSVCGACGAVGGLRPAVVWFGEIPLHMERIADALLEADLFVSIGTSGEVYPAAGFVEEAARCGAETLELNLEATSGRFDESIEGRATEIVPAWTQRFLSGG